MSQKLFVGSLSFKTTDEDLRKAFEEFGEVTEAKVIHDRESGRSRGFGFVTYVDAAAASKAISEMNDTDLDGRTIKVNAAEEKAPRSGGGGGRGGFGGGHDSDRGGYGGGRDGGRGGRGGQGGGGGGRW